MEEKTMKVTEDRRVKWDELESGRCYYAVCCGDISKVFLQNKINDQKMLVYHQNIDFYNEEFYSDNGIVDCPGSYRNKLNAFFWNEEDARDYIKTEEYQNDLRDHNRYCDELDEMLDWSLLDWDL